MADEWLRIEVEEHSHAYGGDYYEVVVWSCSMGPPWGDSQERVEHRNGTTVNVRFKKWAQAAEVARTIRRNAKASGYEVRSMPRKSVRARA